MFKNNFPLTIQETFPEDGNSNSELPLNTNQLPSFKPGNNPSQGKNSPKMGKKTEALRDSE
jgi:hypothetical protein